MRTCVSCECLKEKIPGEFLCTAFNETTVNPDRYNAEDCEYYNKDVYIWEEK